MRFTILALLFTLSASASSPEYLVGGAVPTAATQTRVQPALASDGTDYFAVWTDDRSGFSSVTGTRIARDGRVLDPLGIRIAATARSLSTDSGPKPQVAWDGAAYLVAWSAPQGDLYPRSVYAARIAPDGRMVMQPRVVAEGGITGSGQYVASNGSVSVIAYQDNASGQLRIAVLDRDGNTLRHETFPELQGFVSEPAVAAGRTHFVVAWRSNPGFSIADDTIKAVRLTAAGQVDGTPVTAGRGEHPAIATDGTRFTITSRRNIDWQDFILVSRTFDENLDPVSGEHELLHGRQLDHATVLWTGAHYEVVTARHLSPGHFEIVTIALDRDGNPQAPRGRGTSFGELFWLQLAAATNGTDLLLTRPIEIASPARTQMFAQLYAGNSTTSSAPILLSWSGNAHRDPSIAASALGHLVAWVEDDGVYATRVDRQGSSLDGRGIRLTGYFYGFVRAAFDGTNYVVAWGDAGFIGLRWIAPHDGATVAAATIPAGPHGPELALAVTPEATYLAYVADRVRVVRIPNATHTPDPAPLAVSPEDMYVAHPALAWNGEALLVTWNEMRTSHADPPIPWSINVHAARVTPGLSLLDPAPLLIAATNEENEEYELGPVSVASNGTDWLVVSTLNGTDVIARRVLQDGDVRGNAPVKIGKGIHPVVAWNGSRFAVAWKEGNWEDLERPVVLAAVPEFGTPVATNRVLVSSRTAASGARLSIVPTGNGAVAVAYTRVSNLLEHAGVERSFFRVLDFNKRDRAIRR